MAVNNKKAITLKTLNKSNVWDLQENDVFRIWESVVKDADAKENTRRFLDIVKTAFELEEVKVDKPEVIKKYQARDFKVAQVRVDDDLKVKWAVKKKPILRITDLTYENIHHISAVKLIEVLERNFGGGWESISQSIRDIIESGFDISTTTLPQDRLKKKGSMYDKKIADGFEVLEIPKGTWVEAIFAKEKPEAEKPHFKIEEDDDDELMNNSFDEDENDDELPEIDDHYNELDEDEDEYDEDKLTEESYRTTFDADPEDLGLDVADESGDDDEY
jgi:hypothetical protein